MVCRRQKRLSDVTNPRGWEEEEEEEAVLASALARAVFRASTVSLVHIRWFNPHVPKGNVAFVPTPNKPSTLHPL